MAHQFLYVKLGLIDCFKFSSVRINTNKYRSWKFKTICYLTSARNQLMSKCEGQEKEIFDMHQKVILYLC